MRTFTEWLNEGSNFTNSIGNQLITKAYPSLREITIFTNRKNNYIEDLYMDIFNGKKVVDTYFKKADEAIPEIKKNIKEFSAHKDESRYVRDYLKDAEEALEKYPLIKKAYEIWEDTIQTALKIAKVGEKIETVLPKLAKMTQTTKYFSISKLQYTNNTFFAEYSVEELKEQIERYHGTIKINAPLDFYVIIENGKVKRSYF